MRGKGLSMHQQSTQRQRGYRSRPNGDRPTKHPGISSQESDSMRAKNILIAATASAAVILSAAVLTVAQPESRSQNKSERQSSPIQVAQQANTTRRAVLAALYRDSLINVRSQPSTRASIVYEGRVGESVQILEDSPGRDDRYTWHRIRFDRTNTEGWVREDLVYILSPSDGELGNPPDTSPQPPPTPIENQPSPSQPRIDTSVYSPDDIEYFLEVAMGTEFGRAGQRIRKWESDVKIRVNGTPTAEDRRTLNAVVRELDELIEGIRVEIVSSNPNVEFYFVPESEFRQYEPNYVPVNMGFAWVGWNNNVINRARILVTTVGVTQEERSHLIREELTQSLGLMRDSYRYRDSIFYQGWTRTTAYTEIDRQLVRLLYEPDMRPGMSRAQATQTIAQINSRYTAARRRANEKSDQDGLINQVLQNLNPFSQDK